MSDKRSESINKLPCQERRLDLIGAFLRWLSKKNPPTWAQSKTLRRRLMQRPLGGTCKFMCIIKLKADRQSRENRHIKSFSENDDFVPSSSSDKTRKTWSLSVIFTFCFFVCGASGGHMCVEGMWSSVSKSKCNFSSDQRKDRKSPTISVNLCCWNWAQFSASSTKRSNKSESVCLFRGQ